MQGVAPRFDKDRSTAPIFLQGTVRAVAVQHGRNTASNGRRY